MQQTLPHIFLLRIILTSNKLQYLNDSSIHIGQHFDHTQLNQHSETQSQLHVRVNSTFQKCVIYSHNIGLLINPVQSPQQIAPFHPFGIIRMIFVTQHQYFLCKTKLELLLLFTLNRWVGVAQSVWRLATCWEARGSKPGRGEIFRIRQTGLEAHSRYRVIPGVRVAEAWH